MGEPEAFSVIKRRSPFWAGTKSAVTVATVARERRPTVAAIQRAWVVVDATVFGKAHSMVVVVGVVEYELCGERQRLSSHTHTSRIIVIITRPSTSFAKRQASFLVAFKIY